MPTPTAFTMSADSSAPQLRCDPRSPSCLAGVAAPVSVVILTMNEAVNIADCLASCAWCDDVHVLDSGSTDRTVEIAREHGAHVHRHPFTSFGAQRNWAIDHISTKHPWVFHLDADERFTAELVRTMDRLLTNEPGEAGFHVPNKMMLMGKWLKRAGGYPTYQMRLFHAGRMRFCDYGHGQREETVGAIGFLDEPYIHYNFSKGLYDWFDKHNRYSSLEAQQAFAALREPLRPRELLARDRIARRRAWKRLSYRMPMRQMLRWMMVLFVQGGILEGRPALMYARLISMYERMTALKLRVLRENAQLEAQGRERSEREQTPVVRAPTRTFDAGDRIPGSVPDGTAATPNSAERTLSS